MASEKILMQKQTVIDEIKERAQNAKTIVLFDYRGITDSEAKELRCKLRESNSDYKVYKNTLMARAFNDLGMDTSTAIRVFLKRAISAKGFPFDVIKTDNEKCDDPFYNPANIAKIKASYEQAKAGKLTKRDLIDE